MRAVAAAVGLGLKRRTRHEEGLGGRCRAEAEVAPGNDIVPHHNFPFSLLHLLLSIVFVRSMS